MEANNMKAVREALEFADRELRAATEDDRYGDDLVYLVGCMRTVAAACRAALAAPPRNCDVGTAEERMYRYNRLRDEINERYKRLGEITPAFAFPTAFEWEDRPYEEGETDGSK